MPCVKPGAILLALVLLAGCGYAGWNRDLVAKPKFWPLRQPVPFGAKDTRPSVAVLVTTEGWKDDFEFDARGPLLRSGLVKDVIEPTSGSETQPDRRLSVRLTRRGNAHGYTLLGLIPGIPLVATTDVTVEAELLEKGQQRGVWVEEDGAVDVYWTLLLPLDIFFSVWSVGGPFDIHDFHREAASAKRAYEGVLADIAASRVLDERRGD